MITRRSFLATAGGFAIRGNDTRSFWVLKLLQPTSLIVRPSGTARLHCSSVGENWIVEGSDTLSVTPTSGSVRISGPGGEPVDCVLEIPGVIRRRYFGIFNIATDNGVIIPVVRIDCETATASIVSAELPTSVAMAHALAAQAVVSRSILCGTNQPQHKFADFCDTTHCQFLRSPVPCEAVRSTTGFVLTDRNRILPVRYSAACGGRTEATSEGDYRYVSVSCEICRERGLARRGHGLGLCQEGAMGLAHLGWSWRAILAKYYPNTAVIDRTTI